jgi:hypothetical protein
MGLLLRYCVVYENFLMSIEFGGVDLEQAWNYKINSGKTPVILMAIMVALFGSLTLWLHYTKNGAVLFCGILAAIMMLVLLLSIYRLLFYKILIGAEGFYYQTGVSNGKYYAYAEVEEAWISRGIAQNGGQEQYCNIALYKEQVIRFPFFYKDEDGVEYLVQQANAVIRRARAPFVSEKEEYLIDGKVFGKTKMTCGIMILVVVACMNIFLIREIGLHFFLLLSMAMGVVTAALMLNDFLFFQVRIGKDGFDCRTAPFYKKHYYYNEIVNCREIKRVIKRSHHRGGAQGRIYYFYFEFTDNKGKKHKFRFEQQFHEYEINILKKRIEAAQR